MSLDNDPETIEETRARLARYGSVYSPESSDAAAPRKARKLRGRVLGIIAGSVVVAAIATGVTVALVQGAPNQWVGYPGSAYADDDDVLAADSMETVVANSDAMLAEYRDALTDEFGFTWTQVFDQTLEHDKNGYGGDSMLYFYDSGSWQGEVVLDDPAARQAVQDAFKRITTEYGGIEFSVWNDLLDGDEAGTVAELGGSTKQTQALWSFRNSTGLGAAGLYVSSQVYDRNIPVDDSFDGDYVFVKPSDSSTLLVTVFSSASALLAEADRDTYIEAIAPYGGKTKPNGSY